MGMPIKVYTPFLDLLLETELYTSMQYHDKFYEIGEFELHINQYTEGIEHFKKDNLIMMGRQTDKVGIIKQREIQLDESGKASENWTISGIALKGVLNQRVTIPPSGRAYDKIDGSAETVMKYYIKKHFINPPNRKRQIPQIEVAEDQKRGGYEKWESRFKNVADEIETLARKHNLGWIMYADMDKKKWVFDVVEPRDLTDGNKKGHTPVFFSPQFYNIQSQGFTDSNLDHKNVGYIGGQGEGKDRKIMEIGEERGLNRYEMFVDARDIGEGQGDDDEADEDITDPDEEEPLTEEEIEALLTERGKEKLSEHEKTFFMEAQILTPFFQEIRNQFALETTFEYGEDFRMGDTVTVFNREWGITMDAPITETKEIHEENGFGLEATFGEAAPSFIKQIRKEFNELKGIEKQEIKSTASISQMDIDELKDYTDQSISAEEKKRIEEAMKNLEESKKYADEEAYQAEQQAKQHADEQDIIYDDIAKKDASDKADKAETDSKDYADNQDEYYDNEAKQDASNKADTAETNANDYADNQDKFYEVKTKKYADDAVERVEIEANKKINEEITKVNSSISQQADEIALKVNKSVFDEHLQTLEEDYSEIKQTADKISLEVTKIGNEVDGLDGNEITSRINQTATRISIEAKRIDFKGQVFGENATFAGEIRIEETVQLDPNDFVFEGYATWTNQARINGRGISGELTNGIERRKYGFDPNGVFGSTVGGESVGGYELIALSRSDYTELNSLYDRNLTFGIKWDDRDSSRTEILAMNENYTYVRNWLVATKTFIAEERIRLGETSGNIIQTDKADGNRLKLDAGTNKAGIWMDPIDSGRIYFRSGGDNVFATYGTSMEIYMNAYFYSGITITKGEEIKTNSVAPNTSAYLYLRTKTSGEARVTKEGANTSYMPIRSSNFVTHTSLRENKIDIEPYKEDVSNFYRTANSYLYHTIYDESRYKQFGVMIDETPSIIHGDAGDSIDLYALATLNFTGIKQNIRRMDGIDEQLNDLRLENQLLKAEIKQLKSAM